MSYLIKLKDDVSYKYMTITDPLITVTHEPQEIKKLTAEIKKNTYVEYEQIKKPEPEKGQEAPDNVKESIESVKTTEDDSKESAKGSGKQK